VLFLPQRRSDNLQRHLHLAPVQNFPTIVSSPLENASYPQDLEDCEVGIMMQLTPALSSSTAPCYIDPLSRIIGVLQHLQVLLPPDATLADVAHLVLSMQQDFGSSEPLENVIQALVGQHLTSQMARRLSQQSRQEVVV
jgi:hypothetical protein